MAKDDKEPKPSAEDKRNNEEDSWRKIADELATALEITQAHVGPELLPADNGYAWFDAINHYNEKAGKAKKNRVEPTEENLVIGTAPEGNVGYTKDFPAPEDRPDDWAFKPVKD